MAAIFLTDTYAGLSGLQLESDVDLGEGVVLSKTYTHLFAHFMAAFAPAPPGQPHPAPWKASTGGFAFDITSQLRIPVALADEFGDGLSVARTIVFLLRIGVSPGITVPVLSTHPFSTIRNLPDEAVHLIPFEVRRRRFGLAVITEKPMWHHLPWVAEHWRRTHVMCVEHPAFALAAEALDQGQFVENAGLILVSLWGAIEALFLKATTELTFRVSSLVATYLEPPGEGRAALQKKVVKLYGKRSTAAHGGKKYTPEDVAATFELLRRVLLRMVESGHVPKPEEFEEALFGVGADEPAGKDNGSPPVSREGMEQTMDTRTIAKAPADFSQVERDEFAAFVRAGGEVQERGLEALIASAFRLIFVYQGACLVAIGALKKPRDSHRTSIENSSGVALPSATYPYELGWVFTLPSARRQGHSRRVVRAALDAANGKGVFATTRSGNEGMQVVLGEFGFVPSGTAYPGRGDYHVQLFVRATPPPEPSP